MKLLITGASSTLASKLVALLLEGGNHSIRLLEHRSPARMESCETVSGNINDPKSLNLACRGMDGVLHLAALTHSHEHAEYFRVNRDGTQNLIDACVLAGVKRIIYISSCAASLEGGGYARSKLEAEKCIKKSGISWLILRPSEVYGQGAGDAINRLIHWVRRYPCVPVIGAGEALLSPVYIDDVVSAMARAILDANLENETILLAGPEALTFDELVDRIAEYFGVKRFKLHLPASLVKFTAIVLSSLGINILVPDQIPRLLCSKDHDISKTSISYSPRKLEEGLTAYWRV